MLTFSLLLRVPCAQTCATLSAQAHKYAKEIMQLKGGGSDSARNTMVPPIPQTPAPVAIAPIASIVAPAPLVAAPLSAPIVPLAAAPTSSIFVPSAASIPSLLVPSSPAAPRALGELTLSQPPSTKDLFAALNAPEGPVKRQPSRLTMLLGCARKAPPQAL